MKVYWTYRPQVIWTINLWNWNSLNWNYTPSFYLDWQFADYKEAGLTKTIDNIIPEDRYTWEIIPWVKKLTRFIIWEYNELYINWAEFARSVSAVGAEFQIEMFTTAEEACEWVRSNTNLQEVETGKFLISEASEFNWEVIEAKYLLID